MWATNSPQAQIETLAAGLILGLLAAVIAWLYGARRRAFAFGPLAGLIMGAVAALAPSPLFAEPDARLWLALYGLLLLTLALIDLDTLLLPDLLSGALFVSGVSFAAALGLGWESRLFAAVLIVAALELLRLGHRRWRGAEGLGQGDVLLMGGVTAWIGLEAAIAALLLGAGLQLALSATRPQTPLPFGPALAIGGYGAAMI